MAFGRDKIKNILGQNMQTALILANGNPPDKNIFRKYISSADWFVCADGGANIAARFKYKPDLIIGDFDSVKKSVLRKFKNTEVKILKDQNTTDLEKALESVIRKGFKKIFVLGATGSRLDHAIGNLSALSKYARKADISYIDNKSILLPVTGKLKLSFPAGTVISLLPISRCSGIVTTGLKWNLKNESLQFGLREGTSNLIVSSPATIRIGRGNLIIYILRQE
jgi:thiamine pyrophosphokinase